MVEYTTVGQVQAYLGRDLNGQQVTQAQSLVGAASRWVDGWCGRVFGVTTPVTDERHMLIGTQLFTDQRPIASVQAVRVRPPMIGAAETALTAGGYEVLDASLGLLLLSHAYLGWWVEVDYTPAGVVPPEVQLATTMLVASWVRPALDGLTGDVQSYRIGQELQVTFRDGAGQRGAPLEVTSLLAPYRQVVFA